MNVTCGPVPAPRKGWHLRAKQVLHRAGLRSLQPWEEVALLDRWAWAPPALVERRVFTELQRLLHHAYLHVPFHRQRMEAVGFQPGDFRSLADLHRLPIMTKAQVRATSDEELVADNIPEGRRKITRTSGSSGEPFAFWADRASDGPRMLAWNLLQRWAGIPASCNQIWITRPRANGDTVPDGWISVFDVRPDNIKAVLDRMMARPPFYLYGYPSTLSALAQEIIAGRHTLTVLPRAVVATAETLNPVQAQSIRQAFGCSAVNRYGSWEVGGAAAQSCPDCPPVLHFVPSLVVPEVLREDGTPATAGQVGRLVLTDLTNFASPFLRYDTGDLAVAMDRCACGRAWPVVASVDGRASEALRLPNGRLVGPTTLGAFLFFLNDLYPYLRSYQLVQIDHDTVAFLLVPTPLYGPTAEDSLVRALQACLDVPANPIRIVVRTVQDIPREASGKRLIIKTLPQETGGSTYRRDS